MNRLSYSATLFLLATSLNAGTQAYIGVCCNQPSTISKLSATKTKTFSAGALATSIVLSPDGTRAYVGNTGSPQGVSVLNSSTGATIAAISIPAAQYGISLLISPDGAYLYALAGSELLFIDTTSLTITRTVTLLYADVNIAIAPDGKQIFIPDASSGKMVVVDTATAQVTYYSASAQSVTVTPDNKYLITADANTSAVDILDRNTIALISQISLNTAYNGLRFVALSPDGSHAYAIVNGVGYPNLLVDVDLAAKAVIYQAPSPLVSTITVSPDGTKLLGAGYTESFVYELDAVSGAVLKTILQPGVVTAFAFSPNGASTYVLNSGDSSIAQVDVSTAAQTNSTPLGKGIRALGVDPGGTGIWAVTNPSGGSNSLIVTQSGTVQSLLPGEGGIALGFGPSNGLAYKLTSTAAGSQVVITLGVIDTSTQKTVKSIFIDSSIYALPGQLAISKDGSRVYVSFNYAYNGPPPYMGYIVSIDTATNRPISHMSLLIAGPMALSADGSTLYVCGNRGGIQVVDTVTMTLKSIIYVASNSGVFTGIALAPNGTQAYVVDTTNSRIEVFNPQSGKALTFFSVGTTPNQVAFTPDGTQAYVTDSVANSVAIVDAASNKVTGSVAVGGPSGPIAFSPN